MTHLLRQSALPVLVAAVLGLGLTACGGSGDTSSAASAAPSTNAPAQAGPRGTTGTIAAVTPSSLEVQGARIGQITVDYGGSTRISQLVAATAADVTVGECVVVGAAQAAGGATTGATTGAVTAATVTLSPAGGTSGTGCRAGAGGGRNRPSGAAAAPPSGAPGSASNAAPGGASGGSRFRGGGAFGTVSAVSATGFTVTGTGGSATPVQVDTTSSTSYLKTVTATATALVVGQCATVTGPADDTGTVTASAIAVRAPGSTGCDVAFGGGRRGGRNGTGTPNG